MKLHRIHTMIAHKDLIREDKFMSLIIINMNIPFPRRKYDVVSSTNIFGKPVS